MGQVTTQPRPDDMPGPGTLGGQRREAERAAQEAARGPVLGNAWRLVALLFAVALAIGLGWLLGTRDGGVGGTSTSAAEAASLGDEKAALLAGGAEIASGIDEVAMQQGEKEHMLAGGSQDVSGAGHDVRLRDEKSWLTARRAEPAEVAAPPTTMTEQAEKEVLVAG